MKDLLKRLLRYSYRLTGQGAEAHDLLQETLLRALESRQFSFQDNEYSWLRTIMRNVFINHYHRKGRWAKAIHHLAVVNSPDARQANHNGGEQTLMVHDIQKAVASLKPWYREVLQLWCEEYSYQEIASKLNIPLGTVKSRLRKSRWLVARDLKSGSAKK